MKTTIELPDELFVSAKAVAARRRTTLRAMIEHALKREIAFEAHPEVDAPVELNAHGFPVLKRRGAKGVASEVVYQVMEQEGL
jgi:hypothetical protein